MIYWNRRNGKLKWLRLQNSSNFFCNIACILQSTMFLHIKQIHDTDLFQLCMLFSENNKFRFNRSIILLLLILNKEISKILGWVLFYHLRWMPSVFFLLVKDVYGNSHYWTRITSQFKTLTYSLTSFSIDTKKDWKMRWGIAALSPSLLSLPLSLSRIYSFFISSNIME